MHVRLLCAIKFYLLTYLLTYCAVCLMEPHMNISKPSVNKSNTGVRTLISHHKRKTLVTLFFVEQKNAWDFHCAKWERETHRKCVSLTRDAWDLAGLHGFPYYRATKITKLVIHNPDEHICQLSSALAFRIVSCTSSVTERKRHLPNVTETQLRK